MSTLMSIDASIISLIILIIIYIQTYQRADKVFFQNKTFVHLIQTNIFLIIINLLVVYLDGMTGISKCFVNGLSATLFLIEPLVPIFWIKYISYQIYKDEVCVKKCQIIINVIFTLNAILSLVSLHTGWFFYIDPLNIYSRGDYFWIHIIFLYFLVGFSMCFIIINKNKIEKSSFYPLMMFPLPPTIGAIIQLQNYGVSYSWDGVMISLLIIYFNIQDHNLNTDYLTGVYNRRQLDRFMKSKIRASTNDSFGAIIIDLNNFKAINDSYGHDIGDEALLDAVRIIKKSLRVNDFLARFGGDEFFIIMDVNDYLLLKKVVKRIKDCANNFNASSQKPYKISFSIGYDVYNPVLKLSADEFFKHIDKLMYIEKNISLLTTES